MRIQHNIMALNAYRNYNNNIGTLSKNLEKLSSGYRINRAGDDAAGLAISEKMRAQITGLDAAQKNVKDGISLVKTAEGALQEVQDMMNRMKYLATQSANGTYDNEVDRANLQKEVDALKTEINRIADSANFNGQKLLNGELAAEGVAAENAVVGDLPTAMTVDGDLAVTKVDATASKTAIAITGATGNADNTAKVTYVDTDGTTKTIDISAQSMKNGTELKDALSANADFNKLFTIDASSTDTSLIIKSKETGADAPKVTGITMAGTTPATIGTVTPEDGAEASVSIAMSTQPTAGQTMTIGENTYEFVAAGKTAAEGNIAVEIGANADATGVNLVNVLKANGVSSAVADGANDKVNIADLTEVQAAQTGAVTATSGSEGAIVENTVADAGVYEFTAKNASVANTDYSLTVDYLDENGEKQSKTITYQAAATTAAKAGEGMAAAIKDDETLSKLFTVADDGSGKVTLTAKTAGTKGAQLIGISSTDTAEAAGVAITNTTKAVDEGMQITVDDAKIKSGDTLTVDGKTYQFVDNLANVEEGNVAVMLKAGETAQNLAAAMKNTGADFSFNAVNNTIFFAKDAASAEEVVSGGLTLQIGDTADNFNQMNVTVGDMHVEALGIGDLDISTLEGAQAAVDTITNAINTVSSTRGDLGAIQNRLEHTTNNLAVMKENIQDAESSIRDTDVADEMMKYTKNNILIQSAQAMLAQANAVPQGVLQLLQ